MTDPADLRRQLAAAVPVDDPAWRTALETVPRELFLGNGLFQFDGRQWTPVHRDRTDPGKWLVLVYQDTTWVTQVDGTTAVDATGPVTGRPTSSSTLPSLIVRMLDVAGISEGHKALEIGTGTGRPYPRRRISPHPDHRRRPRRTQGRRRIRPHRGHLRRPPHPPSLAV
jgi:protein-L-isoaspartate O-methyltransferase